MKRTNIWLTEKQIKWLRRTAKGRGISQAEVVRRAVDEYIDAHTVKTKKAAE